MVVFAQHSIIMHPPFTKIDILSCRNLLIYLDTELQVKLLGLFFYSLNPEGILILGSAETPGSQGALFTPLYPKLKIYRRSGNALVPDLFDFPSSFSRNNATKSENQQPAKATQNIQTLADQLLLQTFAPAGVLVTENGDIIYISGHTGKYLEPAVGKANMNIFAMLRDGLRQDFAVAFSKAVLKKESVVLRNLKVGTNGGSQTLNITIQWIEKPEPLNGMVMIIFNDVASIEDALPAVNHTKKILSSGRQKQLEEEMKHMREEIQNTLEEMQSSQEELKSTNEELQSTNEELQSTNEELTTSKEEMQSLNEELQTVNAELQSKVDDYSRVSNDMKNLLNSTDIATLFLDKELNIRRFTNQATKIFKLIKSDIGRRFTDQTSDLIYPELAADGQDVLKTLVFIEKQIPSKDGRWFTVRIMPYRTFDDRIDGLVITFINMSSLRHVEEQLQEADQLKNLLLNSSSDVIIRLSPEWKILEFNSEAERFFGIKYPEVINKNYFQLFSPTSLRSKGEKCFNKLLNKRMKIKCPMKVITAGGTETLVEWSVNVLTGNLDKATGMILTYKINL
jgi:two-component system CheB/CheR fusion protein